jgi:hypothetical protein
MRCALEAMGSVQALADCLQVNRIDAVNWIAGHEQPTDDAFLRALDIMLAHFKYQGPRPARDEPER